MLNVEKFAKLWGEGWPLSKIANQFGMNYMALAKVRQRLYERGDERFRPRMPSGPRPPLVVTRLPDNLPASAPAEAPPLRRRRGDAAQWNVLIQHAFNELLRRLDAKYEKPLLDLSRLLAEFQNGQDPDGLAKALAKHDLPKAFIRQLQALAEKNSGRLLYFRRNLAVAQRVLLLSEAEEVLRELIGRQPTREELSLLLDRPISWIDMSKRYRNMEQL